MSTDVTRRSTLTAAIAVLAGVVGGFAFGRSKHVDAVAGEGSYDSNPSAPHQIARLDAIPAAGGVITEGLVLTRSGGTVHAFSSRCTHLGCTVNRVADGKIYCPCHGSVFDSKTGAVVAGPAPKPLPPVKVTVRNGGVFPS